MSIVHDKSHLHGHIDEAGGGLSVCKNRYYIVQSSRGVLYVLCVQVYRAVEVYFVYRCTGVQSSKGVLCVQVYWCTEQ